MNLPSQFPEVDFNEEAVATPNSSQTSKNSFKQNIPNLSFEHETSQRVLYVLPNHFISNKRASKKSINIQGYIAYN